MGLFSVYIFQNIIYTNGYNIEIIQFETISCKNVYLLKSLFIQMDITLKSYNLKRFRVVFLPKNSRG